MNVKIFNILFLLLIFFASSNCIISFIECNEDNKYHPMGQSFDIAIDNNTKESLHNDLGKILSNLNISNISNLYELFTINNKKTSLLLYASKTKNLELICILLKLGVDPFIKCNDEISAYDYVTLNKDIELLDLFNNLKKPFHKNKLYIFGFINSRDGVGQIASNIIDTLSPECNINFIESRFVSKWDISNKVMNVINNMESLERSFNNVYIDSSDVFLYTDLLWTVYWDKLKKINNYGIKLIYSMTEYTKLANDWVEKINDYFDAVIVPDDFLIDVYKNSGVKKPIFSLPLPIELEELTEKNIEKSENKPFVFGCSAMFVKRKNYKLLIDAFAQEFGNNPNVLLDLHGRFGDYKSVEDQVRDLNLKNVKIKCESISRQEYINLMSSFDCYVFIPKGEGFSITPREAIALGIPVILSNNTTHKTICNSGIVYPVKSEILEDAYCDSTKESIGHDFNCSINDVRKALRKVYSNYTHYYGLS